MTTPPDDPLLGRLARRRRLARLVILFELLWPAVWPALGVAGLFVAAALLDLPRLLLPWVHAVLLVVAVIAVIGLLVRGLLSVRVPSRAAIDRRIETSSGLRHRPLQVLSDRPALIGSPALWQAHVARSMASLGRLRVGVPRPGLAGRDRRGLRLGLVVALVATLAIAGPDAPARLVRAFLPAFAFAAPATAPLLQAWITPPAYTAIAPIFLHGEGGPISVPSGSHLTVSITGGTGRPMLAFGDHVEKFRMLDASSFQAERELTAGGRLVIRRYSHDVVAWDLTVIADTPPVVAFTEPPGRSPRSLQTRLPWSATDDYGVVSLQAELRLRDRPEAPPVVVAIPLTGGAPKSAHGAAMQDLTANPWAGLPVIARLVGRDAHDQQGVSDVAGFELPERRFKQPAARALIAVRKMLSLRPNDRAAAVRELDQLSNTPDAFGSDLGAYLNLRAIAAELFRDRAPAAIDAAQSRLWQLALHLEEGTAERTARALAQARQELHDALERDRRGDHVDPKELERLMQALQQALDQHLQALAEQARRDHADLPQDRESQLLDARELEKLAQEMQDAARAGRMDEARDRMQELERMLQALQNARPESGQSKDAQKQQRGRKQMGALQDMVQRQGGLLDKSQSRNAPPERRPGQPPPSADGRNQGDQRSGEQRVQQALRRALGELVQQFGDLTGQIPPSLGEADAAMRDAGQALGQGNDPAAGAAEQRAIEALQKGGREMGQQMAKQFGTQPGDEDGDGDGSGEQADGGDPYGPDGTTRQPGRGGRPMASGRGRDSRPDDRRDPLGRLMQEGSAGTDENNDVQVPDQMEQARTRAIQDELRRRGADRDRPQPELDYIDRLLKQF